jgi:diacylglycerol kinase (ATP)
LRAIAILGPNATLEDVRRFERPGVQLEPLSAGNPLAGADAALVFGGDGTVHDHLGEFVASQVPMLPVPLGSGNDFHRAVGTSSVEASLAAWRDFCAARNTSRRIDLGMISRIVATEPKFVSHFCCVGGVGLDSEANRRANAMPRWLRANGGYVAAVVGAIAAFKPQKITIEASVGRPTSAGAGLSASTSLQTISELAMFVAFANAPSYGSGMRIAPQARLDDGLLDLCFVRQVGKARLLRLFPTVFSGRHVGIKEVEYFQAERVRVETETPLDVYADGEFICQTPVEVTVAPKAMRVISGREP